jgi:hypothetical protein
VGGALLCHTPAIRKKTPPCRIPCFLDMQYLTYVVTPFFFVCHNVCVSMRSRVLSCMCVSVLSECAFLDVMPMCSSDTQATPALRRLSLHLSQLVCEQSSHAEAPPVGKQRKAG